VNPETIAAINEYNRLKIEDKLVLFEPYDENQRRALTSTKDRIAVIGPNRQGKTTIGAIRAGYHFTGHYPSYFPRSMRFHPPTKGRIIIAEYKEHGAVLVDKIKEWFPRGSIRKFFKNPQGYVVGIEGTNDSRISILTHEQTTASHEGWDGHWAWFDEPAPKDKFIATLRGLVDRNGQVMFTLTPLREPWVSDEIYEENPLLWDVIELTPYANPYVSRAALDKFYASVDPIELQARKFGKFIHLSGRVYSTFNHNVHVVPQKTLPPEWPRFCVVDPHDRRPFAIGWYAVDPTDRIWIYDEYPPTMHHKITSTTLKTHDFAVIIRDKEGTDQIANRIIDARYGPRRHSTSGLSIQEELAHHALYFEPSYGGETGGDIETGHLAVKEYLGRPDQSAQTFVMDNCINHIYGFAHYVFDEKTGKPREMGKDFMDLVRYICMYKPKYHMWVGSRKREDVSHGITGYGE